MRALRGTADIFTEKCFVLVATVCGCVIIVRKGGDDLETAAMELEQSNASLKQIADSLGYSQRHIARKIKERYGKSFSQIRREKDEASGSHL